MCADAVDDDAESLVQPFHRIGFGHLAEQLDDLLDRCWQVRKEGGLVKVPSVAAGETARGREADRLIGRRVPADQVDKERIDLGPRGRREIFADPVAEEPGDPSPDDAVAAEKAPSAS